MARVRKTNLVQRQRNYLAGRVRAGVNPDQVIAAFRRTHPNTNATQIIGAVRRAAAQLTGTQAVRSANQLSVNTLAGLLGCPGRAVSMRIVIRYTDATGRIREFGDTVHVPGGQPRGRVYALIGEQVQRVIDAANLNESTRMLHANRSTDPNFRPTIAYAECVR